MTLANEARTLARARAAEIAALAWGDLDAYGDREEVVESSCGRQLRVRSYTFWDMGEWESDMYVVVKVYSDRGWRRIWPWKAVSGVGPNERKREFGGEEGE